MQLLRTLFGLTQPVSRRTYAIAGFSLAFLKYAVDATLGWIWTGELWNPFLYLLPLVSLKSPLRSASTGVVLLLELWTLPFLWIGLVMTMRRLVDAGMSRWLSLVYFVPGLNYLMMLCLCALPSRPLPASIEVRSTESEGALVDGLLGIISATAIALAMIATSVYLLEGYGSSLFLGTPVVIGAVNGYLVNRRARRSWGWTLGVVSLSILLTGAAVLLVALEGAICLLMAAPIALAGGLLGATLGWAIANGGRTPPHQIATVLLALPLLAGFESRVARSARREVVSSIEIDVPPERVWPSVIGFSELPAPRETTFRTGIAFPRRAHIEGEGAGAIRYCEFSTGAFVEPITVWQPPSRLSFDVAKQPDPMREWSPYRDIHPPHLDGYFRSVAGEFRLIALPGGRTLLEGSTWYELDLSPHEYWAVWADGLVHAIHMRVLEHVKHLAESDTR